MNVRVAVLRRNPIANRIIDGFVVRPWLTDIGLGAVTIWWGLWVGIHTHRVAVSGGWERFAPILPELACCAGVIGICQVSAAVLKNVRARQIIALCAITFWSGIASGITGPSGQAAYTDHAILNAFILLRAF